MGLGDHLLRQRVCVVRAEQPQRRVRADGQVEQRLVELRLLDLRVASAGPDGFADTANRLAVGAVAFDEVAPSRE